MRSTFGIEEDFINVAIIYHRLIFGIEEDIFQIDEEGLNEFRLTNSKTELGSAAGVCASSVTNIS